MSFADNFKILRDRNLYSNFRVLDTEWKKQKQKKNSTCLNYNASNQIDSWDVELKQLFQTAAKLLLECKLIPRVSLPPFLGAPRKGRGETLGMSWQWQQLNSITVLTIKTIKGNEQSSIIIATNKFPPSFFSLPLQDSS